MLFRCGPWVYLICPIKSKRNSIERSRALGQNSRPVEKGKKIYIERGSKSVGKQFLEKPRKTTGMYFWSFPETIS